MKIKMTKACVFFMAGASILAATGCKKKDKAAAQTEAAQEEAPEVALRRVRGKSTPFSFEVPRSWKVAQKLVVPPVAEEPKEKKDMKLTGRLIFKATAPKARGDVPPRLEIYHDPWLPAETTTATYMKKQREDNQAALSQVEASTKIRSLQAEPFRRDGRTGITVHNRWTTKVGGKTQEVIQKSVLLLERNKDGTAQDGYAVVITYLKIDDQKWGETVAEMLDSVKFLTKKQAAPTETSRDEGEKPDGK